MQAVADVRRAVFVRGAARLCGAAGGPLGDESRDETRERVCVTVRGGPGQRVSVRVDGGLLGRGAGGRVRCAAARRRGVV